MNLVRITTRDGYQLDGALARPTGGGAAAGVDAWCLVHGTGGNFYQSSLFDFLGERLVAQGAAVLRVNTRGHDGISTAVTSRGGVRVGAAFERVDDCRHDLVGWVDWLRANVGPRVGLLGHSMGAVKCLYAAAHEPALEPACVVAVSPPRLSYAWFCENPERERFLEQFQRAEALVETGQGGQLMEVTLPLPMIIAAAGFVDKYGPHEKLDYFGFISGVRCPILVLLGEKEVETNMAFRQAPARLGELGKKRKDLSCEQVAGADHFYTGVREAAWSALASWLARQA